MIRRSPPAAPAVLIAALLLAALAVLLPGGCGKPGDTSPSPAASPSASPTAVAAVDELLSVRAAFAAALVAVQNGDRAAWREALLVGTAAAGDGSAPPVAAPDASPPAGASSGDEPDTAAAKGGAAVTDPRALREDLDEVFAHLEPLKLRAPQAVVRAVPGRPHFYSVRFTALIGRAGPPDRILAERILEVRVDPDTGKDSNAAGDQGDGGTVAAAPDPAIGAVRIVGDDTPAEVLRENVMAFNHPRSLVRQGLTLVYENAWRARAARLAPQAVAARDHIARMYGVDAGRPIMLFLYASRDQVMLALAALPGTIDPRIKYFSHPAARVAGRLWSPTDVGVIAPALNGIEEWAPYMLQHEVAHAYTLGWFFDTAHAPDFLEEGLAVAAEESHDWTRLKDALASGDVKPPLAEAIALGDIWSGRDTEAVRVLYSAAGSMVDFILERWGRAELRRWVVQVSDSDLSREAIADVTKRRFGIGWSAFEADWRAYVEQLP